jgi:hypothetical protein
MVVLGRSVRYIKETLEDMAVVATQIGLSMNNAKTKYMIIERIIMTKGN